MGVVEVHRIHHRATLNLHASNKRAKRSFVPDIRQVSDTHRTWLEFQSGNWVGSCHSKLQFCQICHPNFRLEIWNIKPLINRNFIIQVY
ncbi:hypothetical protein Prudu_005628 [Prunus dulcis]|uniref:Uncharacterized protein n=1 Tax=Prunus dulcis TaxID=3755 RepID=A0A4Y1QY10_PRUDU|nr:hypothetical protein Prudu_005628 [Prunus dulcis]